MSRRKTYSRFMLEGDVGHNVKLGRLTDAEFRAWVCGVLPIAAQADPRGAFMVGASPATAEDVCFMSRKTGKRVAETLLRKLRDMKMLEFDEEIGAEWVHDWDLINPAPKLDSTNAERQARYRERQRHSASSEESNGVTERYGDVTPAVTNAESNTDKKKKGNVEEETPLTPHEGGRVETVKFNGRTVPRDRVTVATKILEDFNDREGTSYQPFTGSGKPSEPFKRVLGAIIDRPHIGVELGVRINEVCLAADRFWEGPAQPGNVWGPGVVDRNVAKAMGARGGVDAQSEAVRLKLLQGPKDSDKLREALKREGVA